MSSPRDNLIASIYSDPRYQGGLSSVDKLFAAVRERDPRVTRDEVKNWLRGQFSYTLHHQARRTWDRNKIIVDGPHIQCQIDIADMSPYKGENRGYRYILTMIDCFSRFGLAEPMMTKTAKETADVLGRMIDRYPIQQCQADRGREWYNQLVRQKLAFKGTFLFYTHNQDIKCSEVERFNQSIKRKVFRLFTLRGNRNWVDHLQDIIHGYNNTIHRTIKMKPADVTEDDKERLFKLMYDGFEDRTELYNHMLTQPLGKSPFKVGDIVKLRYYLPPLEHSYLPNYDDRYFKIARIVRGYPYARYKLIYWEKDKSGQDIPFEGSFYAQELQHVNHGEYRIEVKERRGRGSTAQALVHYLGYPKSFDAWVPASQVRNLQQ